MSKAAPSSTVKTQANRLPAPSLFVGPPSRNASALELPKPSSSTSNSNNNNKDTHHHVNFKANPSAAIPGPTSPSSTSIKDPVDALTRDANNIHNDNTDEQQQPEAGQQHFRRGRRGTAVLDAHWAALQSTLGDIELSASSSAHVFGTAHAAALEDLRKAQVELARAWGPAGTDMEDDEGDDDGKSKSGKVGEEGVTELERTKTATSGRNTVSSVKEADKRRGSRSEEEKDLDMAAKRREEGNKYFAKVKTGVQDVVAKLEAVSKAMRAVEMESREIWGDGDSTTDLSESVAS